MGIDGYSGLDLGCKCGHVQSGLRAEEEPDEAKSIGIDFWACPEKSHFALNIMHHRS